MFGFIFVGSIFFEFLIEMDRVLVSKVVIFDDLYNFVINVFWFKFVFVEG